MRQSDRQDYRNDRIRHHTADRWIKRWIWAYILLIIFEGALRKWVLPGLATPLLIIRDPVAMVVLWMAATSGRFPRSIFVYIVMLIGFFSLPLAIAVGHGNAFVAAYGARILLIHFPMAFVIGRILNRNDVLRVGRAFLWVSLPMAVLIALQFNSPQSAWVNRGVGGDLEGAGFSGALGYSRPPGTFSFTNGLTSFFSVVSSFIFYFWFEPTKASRWLLISATVALMLAIPLSISRGLLFQVVLCTAFASIVVLGKPQYFGKVLLAGVGSVGLLLMLSLTPVFQKAQTVMAARFEDAGRIEGGLQGTLGDRYLGGLVHAIVDAPNSSIVGGGIGMGTNVGAKFITGERGFMVAEGEWGRMIGEVGPIFGLTIVLIRIMLAFGLLRRAFMRIRNGDPLPWLLLSTGFLVIMNGGWAQPTALGFFVLTAGLIMSALRDARRIRSSNPSDLKTTIFPNEAILG